MEVSPVEGIITCPRHPFRSVPILGLRKVTLSVFPAFDGEVICHCWGGRWRLMRIHFINKCQKINEKHVRKYPYVSLRTCTNQGSPIEIGSTVA